MRALLALAACFVLGGCFMSDGTLYADADATCPVTSRTVYTISQVGPGGQPARLPNFALAPDGRACRMENLILATEGPSRALFVPLQDGWHVLQRTPEGQAMAIYQLARIEGDRITIYLPMCADFHADVLREWNIETTTMPGQGAEGERPGQPPGPRPAPSRAKQGGPLSGGPPSMICTPTTRAQLETAFRAWIRLGRPPHDIGERTR